MSSNAQSPEDNLKNFQTQLVVLLRNPNYFSINDIHQYWQDYIDVMVDWSAILKSGKNQAELAGEFVANITRKGKLSKFAAVILKVGKGVIPNAILDTIQTDLTLIN